MGDAQGCKEFLLLILHKSDDTGLIWVSGFDATVTASTG
jgi:hypothetical protein